MFIIILQKKSVHCPKHDKVHGFISISDILMCFFTISGQHMEFFFEHFVKTAGAVEAQLLHNGRNTHYRLLPIKALLFSAKLS